MAQVAIIKDKDKNKDKTKKPALKLEYDDKEKISDFMARAEQFKIDIQKEKYSIILKFINSILDLKDGVKLKSLKDFKDIRKEDLNKNINFYKNIVSDNINVFKKQFDIDVDINSITGKTKIFSIIKMLCKKIDYKLKVKQGLLQDSYYITN